jgi:hypothetical protein
LWQWHVVVQLVVQLLLRLRIWVWQRSGAQEALESFVFADAFVFAEATARAAPVLLRR